MSDMQHSGRGVSICRACEGNNLFLALDLGLSPVANSLLRSPESTSLWLPLELRVCEDCKLGQIGEFLEPEVIFDDYPYFSSTSQTWLEKSKEFASQLGAQMNLTEEDLVLEIASNDGYQLKFFSELGVRVLGIEPARNVSEVANASGVPTRAVFFGIETANALKEEGVRPRLIIAKNVLAHVPDLIDFVAGLSSLCGPETLIAIEAPTILQITQGNQFDTIYHEHFSYLSATAIGNLFRNHGLELFGAERLGTHGGSLRFLVRAEKSFVPEQPGQASALSEILADEESSGFGDLQQWKAVQKNVVETVAAFKAWLESCPIGTATVGYGAAAKAVTLLSQTAPDRESMQLVIDNSPGKMGGFLPVINVPIVSEIDFVLGQKSLKNRYVIFPWNLAGEILPRIRAIDPGAEVIVAVPKLMRL